MSNEELGRISVSCVVAVIAGSLLLSPSIWGMAPILWWLVYTLGCGVLLNTKRGEKPSRLALFALAPALAPLVAVLYLFLIDKLDRFSDLDADNPRFPLLLLFFVLVSWLGIFLFSFARLAVLGFLRWVAKGKGTDWLSKAELTVRALIGLLAALALLAATLASRGSGDTDPRGKRGRPPQATGSAGASGAKSGSPS